MNQKKRQGKGRPSVRVAYESLRKAGDVWQAIAVASAYNCQPKEVTFFIGSKPQGESCFDDNNKATCLVSWPIDTSGMIEIEAVFVIKFDTEEEVRTSRVTVQLPEEKKPDKKIPTHGYVELAGEDTLDASISVTDNDGNPIENQTVWLTDKATGKREIFSTNQEGAVEPRPKRILLVGEKVNFLFEFPGTNISAKHLTVFGPSASQTFRPQVPEKVELASINLLEVMVLALQRARQITLGKLEQSSRLEIIQAKEETWWGPKEELFLTVQILWLSNNWWPVIPGGVFILSLVCYMLCPEQYPKLSGRLLEIMGMSFFITIPLFICSQLDEIGLWLHDLLISFREKRSAKQKLPVKVKEGGNTAAHQEKTESMLHWIGDNVIGEIVGAFFAHTLEKRGRIK